MFRVPHKVLKNNVLTAEVKVPMSETVQEGGESMYIVSEYVENAQPQPLPQSQPQPQPQPQPENVIQGNSHAVQNGGEENYQFLNPDFSEVFN